VVLRRAIEREAARTSVGFATFMTVANALQVPITLERAVRQGSWWHWVFVVGFVAATCYFGAIWRMKRSGAPAGEEPEADEARARSLR
jgi:hypothetical protein